MESEVETLSCDAVLACAKLIGFSPLSQGQQGLHEAATRTHRAIRGGPEVG